MNELSNCMYEDALIAANIVSVVATAEDINTQLSNSDTNIQAVAALLAGIHSVDAVVGTLCRLLDDDNLTARCATWALGQLHSETALISMLENGTIDQRENTYRALSSLAARAAQSEQLTNAIMTALDNEMQRVAQGKSGLGEKACAVLAILGDTRTVDALQRVNSEDQYCDRFEIQRLRKSMDNDGKDLERISELNASWQEQFADDLGQAPLSENEVADADSNGNADTGAGAESQAAQEQALPAETPAANDQEQPTDGDPQTDPEAMPEYDPIDWEGFLASDEASELDEQGKSITAQMGPMFEQLAVRALGKPLTDLIAQEFVTLVLQILPQAIPPEYMQAALSPPALNGLQALSKYLQSTGIVENDELEDGVRQIRETIQQQIRASGSLHGSDYDEPESEPAPAPAQ